jgi:hypothetical protein
MLAITASSGPQSRTWGTAPAIVLVVGPAARVTLGGNPGRTEHHGSKKP